MPLPAEWLPVVRSWIGLTPDDDDLDERYDRLLNPDALIREVLRYKIATMAERPSSISLPGGISFSVGNNVATWSDMLKKFNALGGSGLVETAVMAPSIVRIKRPETR